LANDRGRNPPLLLREALAKEKDQSTKGGGKHHVPLFSDLGSTKETTITFFSKKREEKLENLREKGERRREKPVKKSKEI